jgi:hypothetical protein
MYRNPGAAEVFVNYRQQDGSFDRITAVVDTGAEVSLFPITLLPLLDHRFTGRGRFTVEQAGMARQSFEAVEALVTVFLEDQFGARTIPFQAPIWFAATEEALVGFAGILDRAVLHLDMPRLNGYLELDKEQ